MTKLLIEIPEGTSCVDCEFKSTEYTCLGPQPICAIFSTRLNNNKDKCMACKMLCKMTELFLGECK